MKDINLNKKHQCVTLCFNVLNLIFMLSSVNV
jgi:hypothetical protein